MKSIQLLITALVACPIAVLAQSGGAIEGQIQDPSGAVVESAEVTVIHLETGAQRQASTDGRGQYRALQLAPGSYRVSVAHDGFRPEAREGVNLSSGRTAKVDFALQLGQQRDEIVVTSDAPLVSVSASDWGGLVESAKLESLPLNGRDLFELSALEPGATLPVSARNGLAQGIGNQISVNGSRPNQNGFQIDGVYVNDATSSLPASAAGSMLGLETVREIHLVTNPYSAEYGRTAGGLFTAVSKSGSNAFHGALYEYFRNSSLDAKNFFDSPESSIPPLRRNQFGGVISGPIARDKAFFLLNYEGLRQRRGNTVRPVVPNLEARQGRLPGQEIAVAESVKPYLDLYPVPNGRDFGDGTGEAIAQSNSKTDEDYLSGKLDLQLSDASRLSSRYTFSDAVNATPDPMQIWTFLLESRDHFFHSELQTVHSPKMISSFRGAFSRVGNAENSTTRSDIPSELSFVSGLPLGTMTVTGLSNLGGFSARARPRTFILNNFQVNGDLTYAGSRHTVRLGGGFDRVGFDQRSDLSFVGAYTFGSLENLLISRPRIAEVAQPGSDTQRLWRNNEVSFFVQDEIRVRPNLSLTLGVRYEGASTPTEANGKVATLPDLINDSQTTVGGPVYDNPAKDNFAPRAAVAWDPTGGGKTVIRAGGGIFFDLLGSRELVIAGVRMPPLFNRILVFGRPGFPDILGAAQGRNPSSSIDGLDFDLQQPYVGRWQLNIERQLGDDMVVRVGYSGMRGIHLMGQLGNFNSPIPQTVDGRTFFAADAPRLNPAFSRIGLRRSQFNSFYHGLTLSTESRWRKNFRFQAKYTWSKSIDESSSSTFNDFVASDQVPTVTSYRANRGLSEFDLRHVFAGSFSYLAPSVNAGLVADALINGWELHGLTQWQSGNPWSPSVGFDQARLRPGFGDVGQRPDLIASSVRIFGDPSQYMDPLAFGLPQAGFLGNLGRGAIIGPGLFTLDFALHKALLETDHQKIMLRAEFFNVTNRPNFSIPSSQELFRDSGVRVGSAGRITSTTTGSRQIQLALRWEF